MSTAAAPVLLIDAANVLHTDDRFESRPQLTDLVLSWAGAAGLVAWIVWDGGGPDVIERSLRDGSRVVASGAQTADTWIERSAAELHRAGRGYWLVTTDGVLRAVAGARAERMIASRTFAQAVLEQRTQPLAGETGRTEDPPPGAVERLLDDETRAALERLRRGI